MNEAIKWCPRGGCGRAVKYKPGQSRDVRCVCGMEFCFACGDDIHAPATCAQAATWREEEDSNMEEKKEASKDAQVRKKERKRGRRRGREEERRERSYLLFIYEHSGTYITYIYEAVRMYTNIDYYSPSSSSLTVDPGAYEALPGV